MNDILVLGTDTGVGKTSFALLWLARFRDRYEYWKPVETGESDTELLRRLVPGATVHVPGARFRAAVAPVLAAAREGGQVPEPRALLAAKPATTSTSRALLIETFGSPLSPLTNTELQIDLITLLQATVVLVGSSAVGAVGRMLQSLEVLEQHGVRPAAVVLVGPADPFAEQQIRRHGRVDAVFSLELPASFDPTALANAAAAQNSQLDALRQLIESPGPELAAAPPRAAFQAELIERDRQAVWHPYTSLEDPDPPLVVTEAHQEWLTLADGRRVIDGISSWWTILHGHRDAVLMETLRAAAARYDHVHFAGVTHLPGVALAELMLQTMPWPGGRVFYSDDGSTAVEVALKLAYQYWCHRGEPERTRFLSFEGGYHGDTFGAMSVGRDPVFFGQFEPLLFQVEQVPINAQTVADRLERVGGRVAAVIIEPLVQGAGGMRMHGVDELRAIFEVVQQFGTLFIADEVMTGGGRTGSLWAFQAAGIAPDLVCAGKTLAGGVLPLAATLVAPHIVEAWQTADRTKTFFHGHSFTAHPLACAVGEANWRLLRSGAASAAAIAMERFWREQFESFRRLSQLRDVRCRGSILAIELDVAGGYLADVGRTLRQRCLERGVLLRPLGNVLYAMPPLCSSSSSLEQIAEAMRHAVRAALGAGLPTAP